MSKSRRNSRNKNQVRKTAAKPLKDKNFNRRSVVKGFIGIGVAAFGITSLYAYDKSQQTLRDLSIIGAGEAVVVQIYDPACPTCKRLKSTAGKAADGNPKVHFRIADITTKEGKTLQNKYKVPHITLLYIDGKGRHLHTTNGFMTTDEVEAAISQHL